MATAVHVHVHDHVNVHEIRPRLSFGVDVVGHFNWLRIRHAEVIGCKRGAKSLTSFNP